MLVNTCLMRPALVPRGDVVSRCWSTTTAETHRSTARPGAQLVCCTGLRKERESVPGAQLVCCTGLRKEREGVPGAQLVCCTGPPARGYLTQYSAVRWETAPWVRAKARDPLVEEPRGWIARGALAVTPLGKGRAAKNAAECDSQRAPCAKKRVCTVPAHSDTSALDTPGTLTVTLLTHRAHGV